MRFLTLIVPLMAVFVFAAPVLAQVPDAEREARMDLAYKMANATLSIIKDQKAADSARKDNLKRSFAKVVDIDWIAKFVLGAAWRSASDGQRERYTELYRAYLTNLYVSTYAENPDRKITDIKVIGVNDSDADDSRFTTRTRIALSTGENIRVDYLASGDKGKYKVIDVVIEGVSLLTTHRSEFSKIASAKGVDGVIMALEHRVNSTQVAMLVNE